MISSFNKATLRARLLWWLVAASFGFFITELKAQNPRSNRPVPEQLAQREISGIVKDSLDFGLAATTVKLVSDKDTLSVRTNDDGIFVFRNVKSATYTITIHSLGYRPFVARFKQNDAIPRIVMDPIIMNMVTNELNEVVISGNPSITYKTDTVEYRASDYIVRENATVDELLKKMEGMEVGNDGSLVHQGKEVSKAKINGKTYLSGEVATAIQNLPAEIVDKIQMVDDYGDQAARTGIKDGEPEKILNIVTRADRSVGNTANLNGGAGNNERYEGGLFATRLNQNQNLGINSSLNNTVNGVAGGGGNSGGFSGVTFSGGSISAGGRGMGSGGSNRGGANMGGTNSSGGSGGTNRTGNNSFSYRDQWGRKVRVNANYGYNFTNNHVMNNSVSQEFSSLGTTFVTNDSERKSNSGDHQFNFELEADLDSNNFIRVNPTFTYSGNSTNGESSVLNSGLIHQDQIGKNFSKNTRPNIGATVFYQHIFNKPRRNFSAQFSFNQADQDQNQEQNNNIIYYQDESDLVARDSLIHRMILRKNLTHTYRGSMTYVEPLSANTQLELNTQMNYNGYDNTATTSNVNPGGGLQQVDSLSNIYDYSFTQARIAVNYRYGLSNTSKVRFSVGVTAVPGLLTGTKVSLGTSTRRTSLNIIPIARFQYLWSRQHSIQVNYSGNAAEPTFDQIQPVRDVSNPQNPVVGNPDLKVTFNHNLTTSYNNYIANSKLNYSVNITTAYTENAVVRNVVQISDAYNSLKNETRYLNMSGAYRLNGFYSINKQLNNRKYNLSFSGNIGYNYGLGMSNDVRNITRTWNISERFGPRINPNEWLEVNPYVAYSRVRSENSLPSSQDSRTNTLSLAIDGRFYIFKTFQVGYSASKNFVSGINANLTNNPFVVNSYVQKEFWKRRATFTFQAFDLLNQNNFINRTITDNGFTDTRSNALSRYFMLRMSMRLQKWTGVPQRGGRPMMRRGDGSFIN